MNSPILNREFKHPADAWYQIEPKGEHPNRTAGVVQVIDDAAAQSIVNRFNADALAGQLSHGSEMLIDHEHFKHQADKETVAYGWLTRLANRADGIYGQVRWTGTGQQAVDTGDYRFFSTEYDPADLKVLNSESGQPKAGLRKVRPLKLDGLTLTNDPNNKGGRPITNRVTAKLPPVPGDQCCPDCHCALVGGKTSRLMTCPDCGEHFADTVANGGPSGTDFAGSRESADSTATITKVVNKKMKTVCTLLGLSAEADEASVHAAITKLQNRVTELNPLAEENKTLANRLTALDGEQVDAILAEHGVKEEKVLNRLKPVIAALANRAERVSALEDFGFSATAKATAGKEQTRLLNRNPKPPGNTTETADDAAVTAKLKNRASELKSAAPARSFDSCWAQAKSELKS